MENERRAIMPRKLDPDYQNCPMLALALPLSWRVRHDESGPVHRIPRRNVACRDRPRGQSRPGACSGSTRLRGNGMSPRRGRMQPVIRDAHRGTERLPSLRAPMDLLAQGPPASLLLNFALFFLGVSATAAGTLWPAPPDKDCVYSTILIILLGTLIAGVRSEARRVGKE